MLLLKVHFSVKTLKSPEIRVQTIENYNFYGFKGHLPFGDAYLKSTPGIPKQIPPCHQVLGLGNQRFEAPTCCITSQHNPQKHCVSYQILGEFAVGGYLDTELIKLVDGI